MRSTGDGGFANPNAAYAADGSYATATPPNPSAATVLSGMPTTNNSGGNWVNLANAHADDSLYATRKLTSADTAASQTADPEICVPSGDGSVCPKNLYQSLGAPPAAEVQLTG
jgi:hypothetical protein